jgi:hypothetical protein
MDDTALLSRIRVVVVSTRAALRSLEPSDPQRPDVLARGLSLLDDLEHDAASADGTAVLDRFAAARSQLMAMAGAPDDIPTDPGFAAMSDEPAGRQ